MTTPTRTGDSAGSSIGHERPPDAASDEDARNPPSKTPPPASPSPSGTEDAALDAYAYGLLDPRGRRHRGEPVPCWVRRHSASRSRRRSLRAVAASATSTRSTAAGVGVGNADAAAIEACLTVAPPPPGATLVTVRPDLDAFGAMALLALRRAGRLPGPSMRARIERAARADRFDHGPWPGPRPLPATLDALASATSQDPALVAVTGAMFDRERSARARVGVAARWLEDGVEPPGYRERWNKRADVLLAGLAGGAVAVESAAEGRIAVMTSRIQGSLRLGYCLAPVVVAHDPGSPDAEPPAPRRIVIAQYAPGHADLRAVRDALVTQEPGWGGSSTILGSPQGRSSGLALAKVVEVVAQRLRPAGEEFRAESVVR